MRVATKHRVPVVPRGAGSGLSGGSAGIEGALTVALTRMNRIVEIDRENLVAVVQPGVVNADLKAAVAKEGLFYPPDPASYEFCTIGGNIGTNAGGLCCVKYGVTRDAVLGLEVVLADGRVIRTGGKNVKDVAGYSLTHLFVGSQGTLGIVTEATLRLRPAPPPKQTMLAFFPTIVAAGQAVADMTAAGVEPCTLELMDAVTIAAVDDWHNLGLDRSAAALLLVESDRPGSAATDELARAADCLHRCRRHRGGPGDRPGGGRLAAPGPPDGVPRPRAAGRGADGGRRRASRPRPGAARRDRARGRGARRSVRHVRARRGRQPAPDLHLGSRRRRRREPRSRRVGGALPRRDRPRRHGHRRARHRCRPAGVPGGAARGRCRGRHARDQVGARSARASSTPAGSSEPGVSPGCSPRDRPSASRRAAESSGTS